MKRPAKPRPDFPLYAHACGRWACRINKRTVYFGPWADWRASLEQYNRELESWQRGVNPRRHVAVDGVLTIRDLCNEFYTSKKAALSAGEITKRTFDEYERTSEQVLAVFGKDRAVIDLLPADFRTLRSVLAKRLPSPKSLSNEIQRVRILFLYGVDNLDLPKTRYGQEFKRPSRRVLRVAKVAKGKKSFERDELHALLAHANVTMRAMLLLGLNCAFGPGDCGKLERRHVVGQWIDFPRPKTGIARRCKLWVETREAITAVLAKRKEPKDGGDWVFVTAHGNAWSTSDKSDTPASKEMLKLMRKAKVTLRAGRNFYGLRHTFRHVADRCGDQPAVTVIMGHGDESMAAVYRGEVDDERLAAVSDYVRNWLWPENLGNKT